MSRRVAFWIVMPLIFSIMHVLSVPNDAMWLRGLSLIYTFPVILFVWAVFHVMTHLVARFLVPQSWQNVQDSVLPGFFVLSMGHLLGSIIMFPTRPWRMEFYCLIREKIDQACYVLPTDALAWDMAGDFLRLTALSLAYWLFANYILATLFNVRRYGFCISRMQVTSEQSPANLNPDASPLLARLPLELGDDVILLAANQHYIDVHTRKGTALVLYRLSDAITEMGDRGVQIHRSYWVAYDAIRSIEKKGKSLRLVLENGLSFPVSRAYRHIFKSGQFQRMQRS